MGHIFRVCSVVVVLLWFFLLILTVIPLVEGRAGLLPPALAIWGWVGVWGLLPSAALFQIAADVSVIAEHLASQPSDDASEVPRSASDT